MNDTVRFLRQYNGWRRSDDECIMPHPVQIGQNIDRACELIEQRDQLLEALEMLMPQAPSRGQCDEYDRAMWDNAAAAIAKAKGETP